MIGRRLSIFHPQFNRMFSPPYDGVSTWDYGIINEILTKQGLNGVDPVSITSAQADTAWWKMHDDYITQWDYSEKHNERVKNWPLFMSDKTDAELKQMEIDNGERKHRDRDVFTSTIVASGMCGGNFNYIASMSCIQDILPKYHACVTDFQGDSKSRGLTEASIPVPWMYMTMKRPSPTMVTNLALVRKRLDLPVLPLGLEKIPGQMGIRTPGYYLIALHFRNIPVGFEPHGIDLQVRIGDTKVRGKRKRKKGTNILYCMFMYCLYVLVSMYSVR